jgi:hypothetical protein
MKKGGGKQKGASFERYISKQLSLWVSDGESDSLFWRSAMSGGRATLQFKKGIRNKTQAGDLTAIDVRGYNFNEKFTIECKHYKDLKLQSLFFGTPKDHSILEFWNKLAQDSYGINKEPMLISKQNNCPTLLGIRKGSDLQYSIRECYSDLLITTFPILNLCLFDFNNFIEVTDSCIIEDI